MVSVCKDVLGLISKLLDCIEDYKNFRLVCKLFYTCSKRPKILYKFEDIEWMDIDDDELYLRKHVQWIGQYTFGVVNFRGTRVMIHHDYCLCIDDFSHSGGKNGKMYFTKDVFWPKTSQELHQEDLEDIIRDLKQGCGLEPFEGSYCVNNMINGLKIQTPFDYHYHDENFCLNIKNIENILLELQEIMNRCDEEDVVMEWI